MKLLNTALLVLILLFLTSFSNDFTSDEASARQALQREYSELFQAAVDDTSAYVSLLEAQQSTAGVRYSQEKQLSLDLESLNLFYSNLASKFGVEGKKDSMQDILLHIPGAAFIRYDGISLVTLSSKPNVKGNSTFEPTILPQKPFTYNLPSGDVLYFTLDDVVRYYDVNNNQFLEGKYEDIKMAKNLSPLTSKGKFEEQRKRTIAKTLQDNLSASVNNHLRLTKDLALNVEFNLPSDPDGDSVDDIGFYAFMQGYPLPGGEVLTTFSFSGGQVRQSREYSGVIRTDGRHVAYETSCGIPVNSTLVETMYSDEEAARKGYFVEDCSF